MNKFTIIGNINESEESMSEETKLKPCPFCGGEMHHEDEVDLGGGLFYERTVFDCQNADCAFSCSFSESEESVIERFNNRPIEDALRKRVEELEAALNDIQCLSPAAAYTSFDSKVVELDYSDYCDYCQKIKELTEVALKKKAGEK